MFNNKDHVVLVISTNKIRTILQNDPRVKFVEISILEHVNELFRYYYGLSIEVLDSVRTSPIERPNIDVLDTLYSFTTDFIQFRVEAQYTISKEITGEYLYVKIWREK